MLKATANGGDIKCMNIYEVLKAVGFGNMHPVVDDAKAVGLT